MKKIDVSLILPCFNESGIFVKSVQYIVETMQMSRFAYEIIFVDDKSLDNTVELIKKTKFPAVFHATNQGRGSAVRDGIMKARGEVVGYIDIDCEVSPVYIAQMVTLIAQKKADIVIGKRIYRTTMGGLFREVLSRGYIKIASFFIDTGGLDTESGYKFFRRSKILPIIKTMEHTGWFWDTEIMIRARDAALVIVEIPVLFIRRFDKKSSVHVVRDIFDYMINLFRFRKTYKRI